MSKHLFADTRRRHIPNLFANSHSARKLCYRGVFYHQTRCSFNFRAHHLLWDHYSIMMKCFVASNDCYCWLTYVCGLKNLLIHPLLSDCRRITNNSYKSLYETIYTGLCMLQTSMQACTKYGLADHVVENGAREFMQGEGAFRCRTTCLLSPTKKRTNNEYYTKMKMS